jgi:hypothetical protein
VRDVLVYATPTRAFRAVVPGDPSETLYCVYSFLRAVFLQERAGEALPFPEHFARRTLQKFQGPNYPFPHDIKRPLMSGSVRCGAASKKRMVTPVVRLAGLRSLWLAFQSRDAESLGCTMQDGMKGPFVLLLRRLGAGDFSDMRDVEPRREDAS